MRVRAESFGAWVKLDDATLVAVDRSWLARLGIDESDVASAAARTSAPLESHVSITSQCAAPCEGCYQPVSRDGAHVPLTTILATLDRLAADGVFTVALGGGEPLAHPDLAQIGLEARARGLTPVVTTSGIGLTVERAASLTGFQQINVSHDGIDGGYADVRGFHGESIATRAIEILTRAGIPVGVNLVLTRGNFARVEATASDIRARGVRELQLLRYKPAGRAATLSYLDRRLTPEQIATFPSLLGRLVQAQQPEMTVRIDCALVPFLASAEFPSELLAQWGVFGCEAGRHLHAIDARGDDRACSFADRDALPPSAFRAFAADPPEPCASCAIRDVCRGGCKIVSQFVGGAITPDPECPRVRAHDARRASNAAERTG